MSNCFAQPDFKDIADFPEVFQLERFTLGSVGLLTIKGINERMPLLESLELNENKIYELETIDELAKLQHL